jgi:hypothetical protein
MSLDNFQLPPFLIQELYKDSLVDLDSNQIKTDSLKPVNIPFLGKNERNILVLVDEKDVIYLPDEDLAFLTGVLTACKLTLSDVAIVNVATANEARYQQLLQQFRPGSILCFGINLAKLDFPLMFPEYQLQQYNNQSYLAAPTLSKLSSDKNEKMQLWNCLKKLFSI